MLDHIHFREVGVLTSLCTSIYSRTSFSYFSIIVNSSSVQDFFFPPSYSLHNLFFKSNPLSEYIIPSISGLKSPNNLPYFSRLLNFCEVNNILLINILSKNHLRTRFFTFNPQLFSLLFLVLVSGVLTPINLT